MEAWLKSPPKRKGRLGLSAGAMSLTAHTHGVPAAGGHLGHGQALQRLQRPWLQLCLQRPVAQLSVPGGEREPSR
jgi:hypothetical protein